MEDTPKPTLGSGPIALLIFAASIFAYAWQVHSAWIGVGLGALFLVLVPILNGLALAGFGSLKLGTYLRIALFIVIMLGIAISGAELCAVGGGCEPAL